MSCKHRKGLTLIELLVVILVIAILASLLLVALQAVRETSRRLECSHRLRQLAVGVNQYVVNFQVLPSALAKQPRWGKPAHFSVFARMLAFIEQHEIYNAINFEHPQSGIAIESVNVTAANVRIALLVCPSETGAAMIAQHGTVNYRVNMGASVLSFPQKYEPSLSGPFEYETWISWHHVTDGIAATALFSERLLGDGRNSVWSRQRDAWFAGPSRPTRTNAAALAICKTDDRDDSLHYSFGGKTWLLYSYDNTQYNHVVGPNANGRDCRFVTADYGKQGDSDAGIYAARSEHGAGVNCVMGDGSARWISNTVDAALWRSLGTRAGSD